MMHLKVLVLGSVLGLTILACTSQPNDSSGEYVTRYDSLSDTIVYLARGDSVEFQATGPAVVAGQDTGLLVTYHPFVDIADTARVRMIAYSFFSKLRMEVERAGIPWVAMRAVDRRSANRSGEYEMRSFGVVLERRNDGLWYLLNDQQPVPLP